jgi:molecular chaperone GrpE
MAEDKQCPEENAGQQKEAPIEDIGDLRKALEAEKARAESYLANWQRAQADFLNLKRRTEQEKEETVKFANAMLILNLLAVMDDLERALNSISTRMAGLTWVDGIKLIYRKFLAILEAQGLQEIKAVGEPFDPHYHEAVTQADGEEGMVLEEVQKGYKLHDRVIRPAMVAVGRGSRKEEVPEESEKTPEEKGG